MTERVEILSESARPLRMEPKKFALWLFIVSILMLFAGLTSAYIVRRAEGNWDVFELPSIFSVSTVIIVVSSIFMQWALVSARKNELGRLKVAISITTLLGIAFLVTQFMGWQELVNINVYLVGNPSGSFLYLLTGVHGAHLISGVVFLIIMFVATFQYKVHSKQMLKMEMCATYWHFLGLLWVFLFFFILFNM